MNKEQITQLHLDIAGVLAGRGYKTVVDKFYPTLRVWMKCDWPEDDEWPQEVRWSLFPSEENAHGILWCLDNWSYKFNWDGPQVEVSVYASFTDSAEHHADRIKSLIPYNEWMHKGMDVEPERMKECGLA